MFANSTLWSVNKTRLCTPLSNTPTQIYGSSCIVTTLVSYLQHKCCLVLVFSSIPNL